MKLRLKSISKTVVMLLVIISAVDETEANYKFQNSNVSVLVEKSELGPWCAVLNGEKLLQSIWLGSDYGYNVTLTNTNKGFDLLGNNKKNQIRKIQFTADIDTPNYSQFSLTRNLLRGDDESDCLLMDQNINWFGGPEPKLWPVQKLELINYAFVTMKSNNDLPAVRYWLNSNGVFVFVDPSTPLFVNQNVPDLRGFLCLNAKSEAPYNTSDDFQFNYKIGIGSNVKVVHIEALKSVLKNDVVEPEIKTIKNPTWTIRSRYKKGVNQSSVLKYASTIRRHNLTGEIQFHKKWEKCPGALEFDTENFPNITTLSEEIHQKGFRISLWVHPFINTDCEPWYSEAKSKGYLFSNDFNGTDSQLWSGRPSESALIDFFNKQAAKWFANRLETLRTDTGADDLVMDTAEITDEPMKLILSGGRIVSNYIKTADNFGTFVEIRPANVSTEMSTILRLTNKGVEWKWNQGLGSLIKTLLQLNLIGYPFVSYNLNDAQTEGKNGEDNAPPSKELFIRWLQINVFMPSLQFSYVPWDYDVETIDITRNLIELHRKYADLISTRFRLLITLGEPVNPPIWWVDPQNTVAQTIYDQFLLGDDILVAPVLLENQRSRDIYLPNGDWIDGNSGNLHSGPTWLYNYAAPLELLPYFIRKY